MTQVINNVLIIELTPADKAKTLLEQIAARYEKQIADNALLRTELERIRTQQAKMALMFPG